MERRRKSSQDPKQDSKFLLLQAGREVRSLLFRTNTLITTEIKHIEITRLHGLTALNVEILPDTYAYYKINVKKLHQPAVLHFDIQEDSLGKHSFDFKVYISKNHLEPNRKHCEKFRDNPETVVITSPTKTFQQDFVYMKLESEEGASRKIRLTFPKEEELE